jgi:hypothetical protein
MEFENVCKARKDKFKCERRSNMPVESKNQMDIVWIIWDILLYYGNSSLTNRTYNICDTSNNSEIKYKIILSLLELFVIKYNNSVKKKRKYIIYFAFALLIENSNINIALFYWFIILYVCIYYFFISYIILKT